MFSKREMGRRDVLKLLGTGAAALATRRLPAAAQAEKDKPNIVLIMADDLGYECVGAHGGTSYKTPALDKLAGEGMRLDHCYSQPLCTPSRAQIMTGMYNVRNYVRFGLLDGKQTTFANIFRDAGYATCVAGKWQLAGGFDAPKHFGFDEYCLWQLNRRPGRYVNPGLEINGKQADYSGGQYGPDLVSDYICDFMGRKKAQPFLVYYPMILPHGPFEPTPDSRDWDPRAKSADERSDRKYFADMVAYVDKMVGKVVARLNELHLRDNTLVLFTGDNGTAGNITSGTRHGTIKGGKGLPTDAGTHVPLIASRPGVVPVGKVSQDLVDFTDFLPTLCDCAGLAVPKNLTIDGRSFWPQLTGEKGKPRQWTYCWYSQGGGPAAKAEFARNQRYKLYRTGKFYDLKDDKLEKSPLPDGSLDKEATAARKILEEALAKYADARPQRFKKNPK
jgi:arylsulfatase A